MRLKVFWSKNQSTKGATYNDLLGVVNVALSELLVTILTIIFIGLSPNVILYRTFGAA